MVMRCWVLPWLFSASQPASQLASSNSCVFYCRQ